MRLRVEHFHNLTVSPLAHGWCGNIGLLRNAAHALRTLRPPFQRCRTLRLRLAVNACARTRRLRCAVYADHKKEKEKNARYDHDRILDAVDGGNVPRRERTRRFRALRGKNSTLRKEPAVYWPVMPAADWPCLVAWPLCPQLYVYAL